MKGIKRTDGSKGSPTGDEWREFESAIVKRFPRKTRLSALAVVRAIKRYQSAAAKSKFNDENFSQESRDKLEAILGEAGFEFDFPE
ncbi:MAG: hypothetical protein NUV59_02435 [Patescibacteria group bacterium]|nr:hypothetical protein [Patescibacteria group bacterium]